MIEDRPIVLHRGVYKKTATTAEAVFMIAGMTIGAGILGIPYVVAQVGLAIGLFYIIALGLVMLFLNLMIGEIAVRTPVHLQLPGLAGYYLGPWAKTVLSIIIIFSVYGALLAYLVGEGASLSALLGGPALTWSIIFWAVGGFLIWGGLHRIKKVEKVLSFVVISIIVGISLYLLPHFHNSNLYYGDFAKLFLPFGVILFALNGSPAIAEAYALLPHAEHSFRRAVLFGTGIPIVVYVLFALAVVGVSGLSTTEVATVGLGERFGSGIFVLANIFAILAMSTGFMALGTALKETLVWDHRFPPFIAKFLVVSVPLLLLLLGLRSFILILEVVGGLFIALEAIIMTAVYWRARTRGDRAAHQYQARHFWVLIVPVLVVFTMIAITSLVNLFFGK